MDVGLRPTLDEIEECLAAPVEGRPTRDEADRRAARWMAGDGPDRDDASWWALGLLHGIDLPGDGSGACLHDGGQLRARLTELSRRRAM
ncbi:hypothetical protein [Streptomyces sp. NPDC004266]|uniref:hypothetical protein n=1 Tax=Streptomyces sp. NPDC004266 TaxID=3364693 RepID=UPI00369566BA